MSVIEKILHKAGGLVREVVRRRSLRHQRSVYERRPWTAQYDDGVPAELEIPPISLYDAFENACRSFPQSTAILWFGRGISYAHLLKLVESFSEGLSMQGVKRGDRVALILPNVPHFIVAWWAVLRLGAVAVPLNPLCSPTEIRKQLSICRPRAVITGRLFCKRLHSVLRGDYVVVLASMSAFLPPVAKVFYFLRDGMRRQVPADLKALPFGRLMLKHGGPKAYVSPDDGAVMLFTGGVTGSPKAVLLTHRNLVANTLQTLAWLGMGERRVIMGVLPFFHSYGMTACHHLALTGGSTLILEPRFKAGRAVQLLSKYRPDVFAGVPTMYRAVLNVLRQKRRHLELKTVCVSGGAPLSVELKCEFEEETGMRLIEGYGLTEAAPITHCNPVLKSDRPGSIGLPFPGTEARIVDLETRLPAEPGAVGELEVRGPQVMRGYFGNASETRMVLSEDGWLSTGDLARMDEEGFFYIVDRKKDLILRGGLNIYPSEIEAVVNRHPAVEESAVVGVQDDYYGEVIEAYVKCRPGAQCSRKSLLEFCRQHLAEYKLPGRIEFVDVLPKNFIGKIVRRKLLDKSTPEQGVTGDKKKSA